MAIGIYKQGQGYWVRVMTAAMIGVITLATAAWCSQQALKLEAKLPASSYSFSVATGEGKPAPTAGQNVTLFGKSRDTGPVEEIGTATLEPSGSRGEFRLANVQMKDKLVDPTAAGKIADSSGATLGDGVRADRPIEPRLLMGLVAAVVILIGAVIGYYFTAVHQRFVDFLIATDGEMKKVNWSTFNDIRKSTLVVIAASFMLAASLFVVDFAFQWFFKTIGVLVG